MQAIGPHLPSHCVHFSPNEGVIRSKMKMWPLFFGGRYCLQGLLCPSAVWAYRLVLAWCIFRTKHVFPPSFLSCLPNSCLEQTSFIAPSDKQSSAPNRDVEIHFWQPCPQQWVWSLMILKLPSNLSHYMILWFRTTHPSLFLRVLQEGSSAFH